ncbi:TetR/AcrR family transcriptional regulator C-terminal domain-containing protein [Pseudonocardia sp. GCM10023141]|uniref:TetR/AcrR family transcriptional regulator C-terminal domain-containing protein n=1 Tax=Pseudonocardia sp. GCM10023141 TaxID=3252653 RepID=UPI00360EA516
MAQRTRGERAGLSVGLVLDAALAVLDRDGLRAVTMRGVAIELGVEAMTLYHYVPNKDALLNGLVDRVLAGATPSPIGAATWRDDLRTGARTLRAALLRHPGVLPLAVTRPASTPSTLQVVEQGLGALCEAGFPPARAVDVINAITVFVLGHTAAEVGTTPVNERSGPGSTAHLATLDADRFPLLHRAATTGQGVSDGDRFTFAVDALLAGFAATLTAG